MTGHRHSLQRRKHSGPHLMYMECIFQDYVVGEQKKSQQWLSSKLDQDPILYGRKPCENMSGCHFVKCILCPDLTLYNVLMAPDMFINPFTSLPKYAKIKGLWNVLEYGVIDYALPCMLLSLQQSTFGEFCLPLAYTYQRHDYICQNVHLKIQKHNDILSLLIAYSY